MNSEFDIYLPLIRTQMQKTYKKAKLTKIKDIAVDIFKIYD